MMPMNAKIGLFVLKILAALLLVASSKAYSADTRKSYVILAGPTFSASERYRHAGDRYGVGGYVVFTKAPLDPFGLWPGVVAGALYKNKLITHLDLIGGAGVGAILLTGGVGMRTGEAKGPVPQVTYGLTVGPVAAFIRRYATTEGVMKEGVITINFPVYIF